MNTVNSFINSCRALIYHQRARHLSQRLPGARSDIAQNVGSLFVEGYNAGLETDSTRLSRQLNSLPAVERSILYEGAFCALASLDLTDQYGRKEERDPAMLRVTELAVTSPDLAAAVNYGVGGALSHLDVNALRNLSLTNEMWSWPAIDSYGCHMGYFRWSEVMLLPGYPPGISGLAKRAFDQGLGRAIWFLSGARPALMAEIISKFAHYRRADLWSGVGTMTGMYGCESDKDLKLLSNYARKHRLKLQLGVTVGAYIRHTLDSIDSSTEAACKVVCHAGSREIADLAVNAIAESGSLVFDRTIFDTWQKAIMRSLSQN